MQNRRCITIVSLLLPYLFFIGCATTTAPTNWLPSDDQMQSQAYGGWVQVSLSDYRQEVNGELIAIDADSLYILNDSNFLSFAEADIAKVRLVAYDSKAKKMAGLVTLGTCSTITHGFILIITAPVLWMLGGISVTANLSHEPIIDYPEQPLESFKKYARFPQGLPQELNKVKLKPKL